MFLCVHTCVHMAVPDCPCSNLHCPGLCPSVPALPHLHPVALDKKLPVSSPWEENQGRPPRSEGEEERRWGSGLAWLSSSSLSSRQPDKLVVVWTRRNRRICSKVRKLGNWGPGWDGVRGRAKGKVGGN